MNKAIQNDLNKQLEELKTKVAGLQNVSRLINNTLSLIGDVEIKGGYAKAVAEIQDWLIGFDTQVKGQMTALQSLLPKSEPTKAIELGVAPADATVPQVDATTPETVTATSEAKSASTTAGV